ncbi:unknown [Prevotella sp. CAG:5226]|nr:unknown [Prevotella sp. CAG:5226]
MSADKAYPSGTLMSATSMPSSSVQADSDSNPLIINEKPMIFFVMINRFVYSAQKE